MNRLSVWLCVALLWAPSALGADVKGGPERYQHLEYRSIGPSIGGRVSSVAGVPGDPLTYYAATASGGVWKTTDGGTTWEPIFDEQEMSSTGSIAVAPSDPNILYLGSGEANPRGNVAAGNGIYKSLDGGKNWTHVWKQEGQIGRIIIHPKNPDIAFAAVLGHVWGPNLERGVYRTKDGGATWRRVLFKDGDTGACEVCFDKSNPNILFAGLWQMRRRPWELTSGGPGSGLYVSRDGGDTWKQLGGQGVAKDKLDGLPEGIYGRVGVAVAPSDPRRVYALIENEKAGGLYRSDDGGTSWEHINTGNFLTQRMWYFGTVHVDPTNPDVIWCPNVPLLKSIDGGKTFKRVQGPHHVDHHDIWIDPTNPKRIIDANDGGVDISRNGGETWFAPPLPICQFYHINVDHRTPYHVSGNIQDIGTACGPSNSLCKDGITLADWHEVGGGETGFTAHDPMDPNIVYAGEYGGFLSRYDHRTRQSTGINIYPFNPSGYACCDLKHRFQWTAPLLISPHDSKIVYHAGNILFRTTDGGRTWKEISPDLTRNDKTKQQWSGGPITGDNTTAEYYCTIFAIAESPVQKGLLWAGSDDGLVHVSRDAGKTWTNVTKNIPGLPEWGTVACIEPSTFEAGTAYLVVDAHRLDDMKPYLWKTTDFGKTWQSLTDKMPDDIYLHVIRTDPRKQGLLFVGTERGVRFSADDGKTWEELKLNLPAVAVHDLKVKDNDLVVGTNGRSIWIFDDLTPLRQAGEVQNRLLPVQPVVRWRYHSGNFTRDKITGDNPPEGAILYYELAEKTEKPIELVILDATGKVLRRLGKEPVPDVPEDDPDGDDHPDKIEFGTEPGVHRVVWNLRLDGAAPLRKAKVDWGDPTRGPLVPPGKYTAKLTIAGKEYTAAIEVRPDPRVPLDEKELAAGLAFALQLRDDLDQLAAQIDRVRAIKRQLVDQTMVLGAKKEAADLVKSGATLLAKLDDLETRLHNPKAEVSYDILAQRGGAKLYSQLIGLYIYAIGSDHAPTQGLREVYTEQAAEMKKLFKEVDTLVNTDLKAWNDQARQASIPNVVDPKR